MGHGDAMPLQMPLVGNKAQAIFDCIVCPCEKRRRICEWGI